MRTPGTTRLRPAEVFAADEAPKLKPVPEGALDIPTWARPQVAPDRHVQLNRALYSVPWGVPGATVDRPRRHGHGEVAFPW